MFITRVLPGSPAAKADIRAGDIIVKVNGVPAFIGDTVNQGILDAFASGTVRLTLKRPTTGRTRIVELRGPCATRQPPAVTSKKLADGVVYVQLPGFYEGAADQVIAKLPGKPKAVVLDLRGNGGGSPREVTRLLGAFAHGKVTSYFCPLKGDCVPNRTDDSVPLLDSRLVVLTDRGCASACEDFSAAVKDNGLGALIGTRTAGAVSGPGEGYLPRRRQRPALAQGPAPRARPRNHRHDRRAGRPLRPHDRSGPGHRARPGRGQGTEASLTRLPQRPAPALARGL